MPRPLPRLACVVWPVLLLACQPEATGPLVDAGTQQTQDGGGLDAGSSLDAGVTDGGTQQGPRAFCASCVESASRAGGGLCMGVLPRCSVDCEATPCPPSATCTDLFSGKLRIGRTCVPTDTVCGTASVDPTLAGADTWAQYGQTFFSTTCVGARHRHESAWPTPQAVRADANATRFAVEDGSMPEGTPLSVGERTRLMTWLACGAP